MADKKFRLITRSDFDGLVCAVLFKELDLVDDIKFAHPKDMQDGTILVQETDMMANLPFIPGVHMAFDHHLSETIRLDEIPDNYIIDPEAPSAARVVYEHYGGNERFPNISNDLMEAVDKSDSGRFDKDDILEPDGWVLLNYLMDARTGLGRFKDFTISNYDLMMQLVEHCGSGSAAEILDLPDVRERVDLYRGHEKDFQDQVKRCTTIHENLGVLDMRGEETIYAGNRFVVYALYPDINISVHVLWGLNQLNTVFAVGKSVLDRTSKSNVGELMLDYGGGGHEAAGTCQIENDEAEAVLHELIEKLTADG